VAAEIANQDPEFLRAFPKLYNHSTGENQAWR
jgi:hypothetical protein